MELGDMVMKVYENNEYAIGHIEKIGSDYFKVAEVMDFRPNKVSFRGDAEWEMRDCTIIYDHHTITDLLEKSHSNFLN